MDNGSPEGWVGGITADEIREVWDGQLRPVPGEFIAAAVPPAVRRFLTEVGLPTGEMMGISFAHDARLSSTVAAGEREYLVLTEADSNAAFAVDVESGQVFDTASLIPKYIHFFNSDIAALVFFLGLLKKNVLSLEVVNEDTLPPAVDSVRKPLRARDPAAMKAETSWNALLNDLESQTG